MKLARRNISIPMSLKSKLDAEPKRGTNAADPFGIYWSNISIRCGQHREDGDPWALQARNTWWMTFRDAIGTQRFESCKTINKRLSRG